MDKNSVEIDVYAGWAGDLVFMILVLISVCFNFTTLVTILQVQSKQTQLKFILGFNKDWMDGAFSTSVTNYVVVSDDAWGFEIWMVRCITILLLMFQLAHHQ